jgi:PAS domain S-box-containing protein
MILKHSLAAANERSDSEISTPLWFCISSLLLLAVAIILLLVVLGDRVYTSNLAVGALTAVLLALACAVFLHIRAWYVGRRDVYATEREFTSVYQHALDGILILDDSGVCLDANPAAFALLGAPPAVLIGQSFAQFYADSQQFDRQWQVFRKRAHQRGQVQLVRRDGSKVSVRYTASANHVPGRHMMILCDITERLEAQDASRESQERLRQVTDNIHELVWMMDAFTKKVIEVNPAYETITGRSLESIVSDPSSYADLIHPGDREHVFAKLENAVHSGHFDEEFRIVRPDGDVRWVWVKASPLPRGGEVIRHLVGTAQDITARKMAAAQVAEHLAAAETARAQADAARAEAEALRKATLAITQNLRMDAVLDTFLRCVFDIIPYDSASVILTESEERLFVARESPRDAEHRPFVTLETNESAFLQRIILMKKNVHLADTHEEADWRETKALAGVRSWIAVPLVASGSVLGLISIARNQPNAFTTEHFRMAKSLAIPAAAAIQNARLYEWAAIYAAERKTLMEKADAAKELLGEEYDRFGLH